jgi:hypothetical protein
VYFYDHEQRLISLPARWTDVLPADPLVAIGDGRSAFRAHDLLKLARLLRELQQQGHSSDSPKV